MLTYRVPGVFQQDVFPLPTPGFLTGVPVFLGYALQGPLNTPTPIRLWPQFSAIFGPPLLSGYLAHAVRGFFENGGLLCYVIQLDAGAASPVLAIRDGLAAAETLEMIDLVCAPDIVAPSGPGSAADLEGMAAQQQAVLDHCERLGNRFAILDTVYSTKGVEVILTQRSRLRSSYGALYHPWIFLLGSHDSLSVPPCGHIAGMYARGDAQVGVHKAPANQGVEGVLDVVADLAPDEQERLYAQGVNFLHAFAGRGIRVWGARTLSEEPVWQYINVRRLFVTVGRWLERFMLGLPFEPNNVRLWVRVMRELSAYFEGLFRQGVLKGSSSDQAFFVKCDSEINPPDQIQAGMLTIEIGLAPVVPAEFIVVRIIHGASGVTMHAGA